MMRTHALAMAAQQLVGTPFRLQGRDHATGLDCVGLVIASLRLLEIGLDLPADYQPRRRRFTIPTATLRDAGLVQATGSTASGDILLLRTGAAQVHLAIATDARRIVHAHAGLGRIVHGTLPAQWPVLGTWRLAPDGESLWQH